ncbi:MAG: hypothetical protein IT373_12605 [Polyangiaceae bacterium]|nr:hypothetical protein [Polyangiaceae bacterium]
MSRAAAPGERPALAPCDCGGSSRRRLRSARAAILTTSSAVVPNLQYVLDKDHDTVVHASDRQLAATARFARERRPSGTRGYLSDTGVVTDANLTRATSRSGAAGVARRARNA